MLDPTYRSEEIKANPAWEIAFIISEVRNDLAPLGWSTYIPAAEEVLKVFDVKRKED